MPTTKTPEKFLELQTQVAPDLPGDLRDHLMKTFFTPRSGPCGYCEYKDTGVGHVRVSEHPYCPDHTAGGRVLAVAQEVYRATRSAG